VISVVIPAHQALAHYRDCLSSLFAQTFRDFEVIWIDSASTDGSLQRVREEFPDVRIIALESNAGYRGGTNAGCAEARGDLILVANQDVRFDERFLAALDDAARRHAEASIFAPKVLLFDDPAQINEAGNTLHFSGLYGSRGLGAPASSYAEETPLATMSGCCFLIRRSAWEEAGGFSRDLELFVSGWHASYEDADLAWRVRLAGHAIAYIPSAMMFHKFERKPLSAARFRSYVWGRWMTLARNYRVSTLVIIAPVLLLIELGMLAFALRQGFASTQFKIAFWMLRHGRLILGRRRAVQATRRVTDAVILREMAATIDVSHRVRGFAARLAVLGFDLVSRVNYTLAKRLTS
jgi:GT2 family glycosyltransferase